MLRTYPIDLDPMLAALPRHLADPRVLPRADPWLAVFRPGGKPVQVGWRLHDLPHALASCQDEPDAYLSQCYFRQPNRRAVNLFGMTHAWIDLDVYNARGWLARWIADHRPGPEQLSALVMDRCLELGLPPTTIQASGRGLYVKWAFSDMVPMAGGARLRAVNRHLLARFLDFGADSGACDVSRVMRVPGSINSKNNQPCRTLHSDPSIAYDFGDFCDEVLPFTLEELRLLQAARREARHGDAQHRDAARRLHRRRGKRLDAEDWACRVVADLTALADIRWGGQVPVGQRNNWTWIAAAHLALWLSPQDLEAETEELVRVWQIEPDYLRKNRNLVSVIGRARSGSPYRFTKTKLIEMLEVAPAEMPLLSALINREEKYRRHKIARDRKAKPNRDLRRARQEAAVAMASAGGDLREIARNERVDVRTLRRWRRRGG